MRLHMNIAQKIKALIKEAELYRSQGLLAEALVKYNKAKSLTRTSFALVEGLAFFFEGLEVADVVLRDIDSPFCYSNRNNITLFNYKHKGENIMRYC